MPEATIILDARTGIEAGFPLATGKPTDVGDILTVTKQPSVEKRVAGEAVFVFLVGWAAGHALDKVTSELWQRISTGHPRLQDGRLLESEEDVLAVLREAAGRKDQE